jgi:hypothetical protein
VTRIINMWAGPRNASTAMMYAWNERDDATVIDEPMYAHYLEVTGLDHPMRDVVMEALPAGEDAVVASMLRAAWDTPLVFIKNMAHHLEGMDASLVDEMDNFILIRDPADMLPSLARGLRRMPTMQDAAYGYQIEILERILVSGRDPIVVDTRTFLDAPETTLRALCDALGIPFDPEMLSWPAGPKDVDGVWGAHWYERLHQSTGFEPYPVSGEQLPDDLVHLHEACAPLYERMSGNAIR